MKKAIVGKKIGMTQIFTEDGRLVPVTVIKPAPARLCRPRLSNLMATTPFRLVLAS